MRLKEIAWLKKQARRLKCYITKGRFMEISKAMERGRNKMSQIAFRFRQDLIDLIEPNRIELNQGRSLSCVEDSAIEELAKIA